MKEKYHEAVLVNETIKYLNVKPSKRYIDATIGGAGHSIEILKRGGLVLGLDQDPDAIEYLQNDSSIDDWISSNQLMVAQGNFNKIITLTNQYNFAPVDGILFDLGMSWQQIKGSQRGFSFNVDEPLDMRMDPSLNVTAADLINGLTQPELIKLFKTYANESYANRITKNIINTRRLRPIKTTKELVDLIDYSIPGRKLGKIHKATKVFMGLRIAVNDELNNLKAALPQTIDLLAPKGRVVVISYHSLEDRIVKQFFNDNNMIKVLTKRPVRASLKEIKQNPAARSAKLRAAEKNYDR